MIEHRENKINLHRATHTRPHCLREKRYVVDTDSQPWSAWDILKAVATFAIGSWIAWRVLDILAGGGAK